MNFFLCKYCFHVTSSLVFTLEVNGKLLRFHFWQMWKKKKKLLYRGRFTIVRNVKPKESKSRIHQVAKILPYDKSKHDESLQEYFMLKDMRQEHLVRLDEAYLYEGFVVLVLEKLWGENVARSLSLKNKYNEHHVSAIIKQVNVWN